MAWVIVLAVLVAIGFLPAGVRIGYDAAGLRLAVTIGFLRIGILPSKKTEKKKKKRKESEQKPKTQSKSATEEPKPAKQSGGSLQDFLSLVKIALKFLGDFVTRLRIQKLTFRLIMAGDDKYSLAVNYGKAWAALGNLLPVLDNHLHLKKRDVEIECDFAARETTVLLDTQITIRVGRMLWLGLTYGIRCLKEFLNLSKRKGGTNK